MASKYWIKLYHEILDNPKWGACRTRFSGAPSEFFLMGGEQTRPQRAICRRWRTSPGACAPMKLSCWRKWRTWRHSTSFNRSGGWRLARRVAFQRSARPLADDRARAQGRGIWRGGRDLRPPSPAMKVKQIIHRWDVHSLQCGTADIPEPQRPPGARAKGIGRSELAADIPEPQRPPGAQAKETGIRGQTADVTMRYTDTDRDIDSESESMMKKKQKETRLQRATAVSGTRNWSSCSSRKPGCRFILAARTNGRGRWSACSRPGWRRPTWSRPLTSAAPRG